MVKNIYAVIGSNYGDEGKGLVTDELCHLSSSKGEKCLNILTNGGCQRGHTVFDNYGNRTVFSHLGSGFYHCDCYFSEYYMINPMVFCKEYDSFQDKVQNDSFTFRRIFVDPKCTITTPWDMLVNRMIEDRRSKRHGSCGYGIWETVKRNKVLPLYWEDISGNEQDLRRKLVKVLYYCKSVLKDEYKIEMTEYEKSLFDSSIMFSNYVADCYRMKQLTETYSFEELSEMYDTLVFENAQGLLLDMDINEFGTPSKTGMAYVKNIIKNLDIAAENITPYYVTRSYLTKHGNGDFPEECLKEFINSEMIDLTNQPNPYQGTLRYGKFTQQSINNLINRITIDSDKFDYMLVVTHCNEYIESDLIKYADFISYTPKGFIPKI